MAWKVESVRLTGFPSPGAQSDPRTWWLGAVGEQPETETSRPRVGAYSCEASWSGKSIPRAKLVLRQQPNRIEWRVAPSHESEELPDLVSSLGGFEDVVADFTGLIRRWFDLETCPTLQRIAFGAVLREPVADRAAGYKLLSPLLPAVKIDVEKSSDLLYQINRPRDATLEAGTVKINRVSKWAATLLQSRQIVLSESKTNDVELESTYACRLELDINTSPEYEGEFVHTDLKALFDMLAAFGGEIAEKGDVP